MHQVSVIKHDNVGKRRQIHYADKFINICKTEYIHPNDNVLIKGTAWLGILTYS